MKVWKKDQRPVSSDGQFDRSKHGFYQSQHLQLPLMGHPCAGQALVEFRSILLSNSWLYYSQIKIKRIIIACKELLLIVIHTSYNLIILYSLHLSQIKGSFKQ